MTSIHHINNKRQFGDIHHLMKKQEKLLEKAKKAIDENDTYLINLETTVRNLIECG